MRFLVTASLLLLLALLAAWPAPALAQDVETRRFQGMGSRGVGSDVEFFLVEGTYRHTLDGTTNCLVTASVFPGPQRPPAALSDVIRADLRIPDDVAADSFSITEEGWVNLQVGTGPDCSWQYTVTGLFLPIGDEPSPPGSGLTGWWPVALGAGGAALLIWVGIRKRPPPEVDEFKVQVVEPTE